MANADDQFTAVPLQGSGTFIVEAAISTLVGPNSKLLVLVNGAYGVLKGLDRSNLVIGGCTYTTGAVDTLQWIKYMRLPNGKPPRMDMYAHNPFTYESPLFTSLPNPFDEVQFANLPEEIWEAHRRIAAALDEAD